MDCRLIGIKNKIARHKASFGKNCRSF